MECLDICVGTSRNESYVRISTAAENGLIVISAGSILDISKYRDTFERSISILGGIAIYRISNESMISQTILGRYTSIEYQMKYRVSYDTILDPATNLTNVLLINYTWNGSAF